MIYVLVFVLGFLVGKFWHKIYEIIKQLCFIIRNFKAIQKSKYYNEFYEDYISSQDYERGDING